MLLFPLTSSPEINLDRYIRTTGPSECLIIQDSEKSAELSDLIEQALQRKFSIIRVEDRHWELNKPVSINNVDSPVTIRGDALLKGKIIITRSANVRLEDFSLDGTIELDQTEDVQIHSVHFLGGGIWLKGRRCNQPRECTSYHRKLVVEDCIFENSERGIQAERLEHSRIERNRFIGEPASANCTRPTIGIDLDGSSEDLDRPLELGHSKGNHILQNSFEQEFTIGIRVRDSLGNLIQENRFLRSYRSMEFHDGARHNQIISNYIGYLSQIPVTSACPGACGIYTGPGSVNNVFINNFFEQNFELQFLDSNRNSSFVIDESGSQNVFRSDFKRISP